jgi:hypothetical protein
MLSSIKSANERQQIINSQTQKSNNNVLTDETTIIINHFEKILNNWVNMQSNIKSQVSVNQAANPMTGNEINIPIIPNINKAKYDEWNDIFTKAGYKVNINNSVFTVSMP